MESSSHVSGADSNPRAVEAQPARPARKSEAIDGGHEFERLLETLEAHTRALEAAAEEASRPEGNEVRDGDSGQDREALKDSFHSASESFREAMEIGERLIEEYRRSQIDS